jgi:predicted GH43/DUF377 family glycosyl hydrolase
MKRFFLIPLLLIASTFTGLGESSSNNFISNAVATNALPDWAIGPFTRPADAQPVIKPDTNSVFDCPMRKAPVHWEAMHTFNPAAVVKDGKVYVLYRAEDDSSKGGKGGIGAFTSRLGLAVSDDGIHFVKEPKPVFYPAEDDQKDNEWYGGCEDPRLAQGPDGTYYLTYTMYARDIPTKGIRLGIATSKDLHNWTKHGFAGIGKKSAAIVQEIKDGHLVAAKINGKYWMYVGTSFVSLASSDDLIHWGNGKKVMTTRKGFADSGLDEVGPLALLTDKGIILFYNGMNNAPNKRGDPQLSAGVYTGMQALFDAKDPSKLIARMDHPYIKPELPWEKSGQYKQGTTFTEGLALFKNQWFLYYGCADTFVGVAMADCNSKLDLYQTPQTKTSK